MGQRIDELTAQTIELLQILIRNRCVNDGTVESGQEERNAVAIRELLDGTRAEIELVEPAPGRVSLVARLRGTAPADTTSLCLMGHTDVVPATVEGWRHDPFGGEFVGGEIWGRGAVDMLGLTASMAVAFRELASQSTALRGDLIFLASADEEAGSRLGVRWLADHRPELIRAACVLTEAGGTHTGTAAAPAISVEVGEKGVAWRRLRIRGEEGHGSRPFRIDNALVKAATVIREIAGHHTAPHLSGLWTEQVQALGLEDSVREALLDPARVDSALSAMHDTGLARRLHASTHTTMSPTALTGTVKTNVIPGHTELDVDIRLMPGDSIDAIDARLREALSEVDASIEVEALLDSPPNVSGRDTPLWSALETAVRKAFPTSRLSPQLSLGFTDARILREMGATAYGAGLVSPKVTEAELSARIHATNERIDVETLELCTNLWIDVATELLG